MPAKSSPPRANRPRISPAAAVNPAQADLGSVSPTAVTPAEASSGTAVASAENSSSANAPGTIAPTTASQAESDEGTNTQTNTSLIGATPASAGPTEVNPTGAGPTAVNPTGAGPAAGNPTAAEPVQTGPAGTTSTSSGPIPVDPGKTGPAVVNPAPSTPNAQTPPVTAPAEKAPAATTEPVETAAPTRTQPVAPAETEPAISATPTEAAAPKPAGPAKTEPVKAATPAEATTTKPAGPAKTEPVKAATTKPAGAAEVEPARVAGTTGASAGVEAAAGPQPVTMIEESTAIPTGLPETAEPMPGPRTDPWAQLIADPGHAPELLALAAVQTIGPRAAEWAERTRAAYPHATPEALARLATRQFTRFGGLTSVFGAIAGSYAPIALLGTAAITQADLVLHMAAAYGLDPTDPERAVDLLLIARIHPNAEEAEAALAAAKRPAYDDDGTFSGALLRLGRLVATQSGSWASLRLASRYFPGVSLLAAILTSTASAQSAAARAAAYYRKAS
jgi:hypothetical protein